MPGFTTEKLCSVYAAQLSDKTKWHGEPGPVQMSRSCLKLKKTTTSNKRKNRARQRVFLCLNSHSGGCPNPPPRVSL
jgi:hypothetical protein